MIKEEKRMVTVEKEKTVYVTSDGTEFDNKHKAQQHELNPVKEEVKDLLNQAVIKLKALGDSSTYTLNQVRTLLEELATDADLNFDATSFYDSSCY